MFVLAYFAVTLFTSATLLFFVQPMIGKMILPKLGGTPAVWNTCMVFFQAVLLCGYAYTHFVSTQLPRRGQVILQSLLLLMPLALLPFSLGNWEPPADSNPVFSVLGILAVVVGVPFFVVSTSAPLLQKWFAFTEHSAAKDPYFLYGASNLGSMLALALYPFLMEPNFAIEQQAWIWTAGFGLFVLLVLGCVWMIWPHTSAVPRLALETAIATSPRKKQLLDEAVSAVPASLDIAKPRVDDTLPSEAAVTWQRRLRWVALAAVPSSLMLGCTTYMTTDIAAIPFFWVLPLELYLLTFILVFSRWPVVWTAQRNTATKAQVQASNLVLAGAIGLTLFGFLLNKLVNDTWVPLELGFPYLFFLLSFVFFFAFWVVSGTGGPHDFVLYFQPCFLLFLVLKLVTSIWMPTWMEFMLHLAAFFFITMMCHGELAVDRPTTSHLTEFYLWMSVGGVLGGLFNALVAPMIFKFGLLEYPLAMVASCFLRPNLATDVTLIPGDSRKGEPTALGTALDFALPLAILGVAYQCMTYGQSWSWLNYLTIVPILAAVGLAITGILGDRSTGMNQQSLRLGSAFIVVMLVLVLRTLVASGLALIGFENPRNVLMAVPIVFILSLAMRPFRFGLALALVWGMIAYYDLHDQRYIHRDRGFFGMVKVRRTQDSDTGYWFNTLIHGGIDHGRQHLDPEKKHEPAAYFHPLTGIGQVFMKLSWPNTPLPGDFVEYRTTANVYRPSASPFGTYEASLVTTATDPWSALVLGQVGKQNNFSLPHWRMPASLTGVGFQPLAPMPLPLTALVAMQSEPPFAVVGLGTGTLAAFAKPFQHVDMYEIDPLVYELSQEKDGRKPLFTYLMDAKERKANLNVILGDGRLKIEKAPEHWYHVICLDAFTSDAIPVHLLTAEAIEIYLKKLAPGGVLVFNTTNKYVDIGGVLKDSADHLGLECLTLSDWHQPYVPEKYGTDFVILRRKAATIEKLGGTFNGGPSLSKRFDTANWETLMKGMQDFHAHQHPGAKKMPYEPWQAPKNHNGPVWTDRYSNLLGVLRIR